VGCPRAAQGYAETTHVDRAVAEPSLKMQRPRLCFKRPGAFLMGSNYSAMRLKLA